MKIKKNEKEKSNEYYNKFIYRIEKKISVEEHPKIKDYAKQEIYLYIIHDTTDNNRFLFLSSQHYEEETKIYPYMFNLDRIASTSESVHLKTHTSKFGIKYYEIVKEKGDTSIIFKDIMYGKNSDAKFFKKYKTHTKKIALDNPDWYIEYVKESNTTSYKKKLLKLLLYENKYSEEIIEHCISTFFILKNPDYQKFNDHCIVLDEGKTGKSSLIGYMGEKLDNVSIAGLYGSSDSLRGKFKGGIVTTTKKSILIDEMNELIKNNKGEKVLSVLNSLLENGTYNYQKQFGQKIRSSNQFFFMGNISVELNLPTFLIGGFGNIETLGRRIGVITYNSNINGYKMGMIRPCEPHPYLQAISLYMSNIFNEIIENPKFTSKLYSHKLYSKLQKSYKMALKQVSMQIECDTTKQFIKSHSESIDRIICRGLKVWIFNNLDAFLSGNKQYDNHSIYEIYRTTEIILSRNIINFRNIKEHLQSFSITDKKLEIDKIEYLKLSKTEQNILYFFYLNKDEIKISGTKYSKELNKLDLVRKIFYDYKRYGFPDKHTSFVQKYGINISIINKEIMLRIINLPLFESRVNGLFGEIQSKEIPTTKIEKDWNKNNIQELDISNIKK